MTILEKNASVNIFDLAEQVCTRLGIEVPKNISCDDRIYRTSTVGGRRRNKNGAIKLFSDGRGGIAWNWQAGEDETFFIGGPAKRLTDAERRQLAKRRQEAAEALQRQYEEAAAKARRIWGSAPLALPGHPYLERKGIEPYGVRERWGKLIIPVYDANKEIVSIQMIAPDGEKRFLKGACNSGIFILNGSRKSGPVLVAEGFATAASLAEATFATVVCAFNASAMGKAAKRVRSSVPDRQVIICADNDHLAGKSEAQADDIGAGFVIPDFEGFEPSEKDTDFNDLASLGGLSEVGKQMRYAMKNGVRLEKRHSDPAGRQTCAAPHGHCNNMHENRSDSKWQGMNGSTPPPPGGEPPFIPPDIIDSEDFRGRDPEPRLWIVEGMVLGDNVTLFSGDGGLGKTTIAMQLALAMQCQSSWLGRSVCGGPTLYVSAEESYNDLHELYTNVSKSVLIPPIHSFEMISLADRIDPALITKMEGKPGATPMLQFIEDRVRDTGARLLILDASADFCDIDEINRVQVRHTIAILRKIALHLKCGVMLLSHPSVDGMKTKRGYSGSTHWNNSVRSRLYLSTPETDDGEDDDTNNRIIEVPKRNKSAPIKPMHLKFSDGRFVIRENHEVSKDERIAMARNAFMELLLEHNKINYPVSHMPGRNYAPTAFCSHPKNPGVTAGEFRIAMLQLLSDYPSQPRIQAVEYGPPSRRRYRIEVL